MLQRVGGHVVELVDIAQRVGDVLPPRGPDHAPLALGLASLQARLDSLQAVRCADGLPRRLEVGEREGRSAGPVLGEGGGARRGGGQGRQGRALHAGRHGEALEGEESGHDVDEVRHGVVDHALWARAPPRHEERNARQAVVEGAALAGHAVLEREVAVVGEEDDDGALTQARALERVEDGADPVVDEARHGPVREEQALLVDPGRAGDVEEPAQDARALRRPRHVRRLGGRQLHPLRRRGLEVGARDLVRRVRVGERHPEGERPLLGRALLEVAGGLAGHEARRVVLERVVGDGVRHGRRLTRHGAPRGVGGAHAHLGAEPRHAPRRPGGRQALVADLAPHVEERLVLRRLEAVVLADQRGREAGLAPHFEGVGGTGRHGRLVVARAVSMRVLPGPEGHAGGHAQGVGRERVLVAHALGREPRQGGRGRAGRRVEAARRGLQLVGHDDDHVGRAKSARRHIAKATFSGAGRGPRRRCERSSARSSRAQLPRPPPANVGGQPCACATALAAGPRSTPGRSSSSARWHATKCPGRTSRSAGVSALHWAVANGQRGWK